QAIGQAFHITTDEVLTWNQIFHITAASAGVEPHIVHIPSDFIGACLPDRLGGLLGDKAVSAVFDNSSSRAWSQPSLPPPRTPRASAKHSPGSTPILPAS
ncbi:MAG: hypothetical protein IPP47_21290, partial [Bryobacterales bacterium]|nr:hypothetical protein [Bryobacterales bacterium]